MVSSAVLVPLLVGAGLAYALHDQAVLAPAPAIGAGLLAAAVVWAFFFASPGLSLSAALLSLFRI